jgi:hypothetical protein
MRSFAEGYIQRNQNFVTAGNEPPCESTVAKESRLALQLLTLTVSNFQETTA